MSYLLVATKVCGTTLRCGTSNNGSSVWRERPLADQILAEINRLEAVDFKESNRYRPGMSTTSQDWATPLKMSCPPIFAGVEQSYPPAGPWVQAGNIRPLVTIAEETGQGEVICLRRPVMLAGDNMINRVWQR
jgi:hypothetical protein